MDETPACPQQRPFLPTPEAPVRLSSETLFGAGRELVIVHNGREYHLRLTQNDKMILTA